MSVLIKDMEMPKSCLECPFEEAPEFDSYCIAIGDMFIGKWEDLGAYKPNWCPLEEPRTGECETCKRNVDNGGFYDDGRTRCPIQEHYALPKDGYCHLYEPMMRGEEE